MLNNIFRQNTMESSIGMIESLFEKTVDYGKTSFLLVKLKTLNKTSDVVSSLLAHTVVLIFALLFMLFLSLGIAIWLGEIFGSTFYGKPVNLLRSSIRDVASLPYLIDNIIGTAVGLATGYLSRKIVIGTSGNLIRKLFGFLLQLGVTNTVAQHPGSIKSMLFSQSL